MSPAVEQDRNALVAEVLPDYRGWLLTVARNMTTGTAIEDLAQEGWIAMWRACGTYDPTKGSLPSWLTRAAANRMRDVATGRDNLTGAHGARAEHGDARGRATRAALREHLRAHPAATNADLARAVGIAPSTVTFHRARLTIDDHATDPGTTSLDVLLDDGLDLAAAGDVLDAVLDGYHAGQIAAALDVLTPAERRYVVLRFWHGLGTAELRDAFGYQPHALWRTARARLAPVLADLVAA